ncbi:MAG: PASTA domain-containing protein [Prolixibacteraceae bacterium]
MAIKEFIRSKTFGKHVMAALLLTIILLWLTIQILSLYTHRGESLSVPDFSGMTLDEAKQASRKMNLRFELEEPVYRADKKPGTILAQNPGAGHKIKSGRMMYLTLVSSIPGTEEVPKVTDISLRQAKVLLESKGFIVGKIEFIPSEFNDLVLEQKNLGVAVSPGARLDSGSAIDLVVGKSGGIDETIVPDFTGLPLAEVLIMCDLKQLTAGSVVFDPSVVSKEDSMAAKVITQFPIADSTVFVPAGSAVNLVLSLKGKE